jgi:hypothetical protein
VVDKLPTAAETVTLELEGLVGERGADLGSDPLGESRGDPAFTALDLDELLERALISEVLEAIETRLDVRLDNEALLAGDLTVEVEIEAF